MWVLEKVIECSSIVKLCVFNNGCWKRLTYLTVVKLNHYENTII